MNAENTEIISQEQWQGTPFTQVNISTEDGKFTFLTLGKYRLTEPKETDDELEAASMTWDFQMSVTTALIQLNEELKNKEVENG